MPQKLPLKHKHELQELNLRYRSNSERLQKEVKVEGYFNVAGLIGTFVTIIWLFNPQGVETSIGSIGLSMASFSMLIGAWSYFAPPSESVTKPERYVLISTEKRLEELGYDPHFYEKEVAFKDSKNFLDVYSRSSYEDETDNTNIIETKGLHEKLEATKSSPVVYEVYVDDNANFMDDDERYLFGEYVSEEEAVEACKLIINQFFNDSLKSGVPTDELYDYWCSFAESPFIKGGQFSASIFAKEKMRELISISSANQSAMDI
jgi:hypothetical protein